MLASSKPWLTQRTVKLLSNLIGVISFLKLVPFDWDKKTFRLSVTTDWKIYLYYISTSWSLFHAIYLNTRYFLLAHGNTNTKTVLSKILHVIYCISFSFPVGMNFSTFIHKHTVSEFVTHFFRLSDYVKSKI